MNTLMMQIPWTNIGDIESKIKHVSNHKAL